MFYTALSSYIFLVIFFPLQTWGNKAKIEYSEFLYAYMFERYPARTTYVAVISAVAIIFHFSLEVTTQQCSSCFFSER